MSGDSNNENAHKNNGRPHCILILVPFLLISGCTSIRNAGDLAVWVREQAVAQGCRRESIVLDAWYTATTEGNVWRGTCRDAVLFGG